MMNKLLIFLFCFLNVSFVYSQTSRAEQQSVKAAQNFKDSLGLTTDQQAQILQINLKIVEQKKSAFQQYNQNRDSLQMMLQRIEFSRDSLYQPILGKEKFLLYQKKKRSLLFNN